MYGRSAHQGKREGGREGGRERGREGEREGGREGGRERGREGGRCTLYMYTFVTDERREGGTFLMRDEEGERGRELYCRIYPFYQDCTCTYAGKLNAVIGKLWGRGSEEGTKGSRKYRRHPKVGTALPTHGHTCDWYSTQTNASRNMHV